MKKTALTIIITIAATSILWLMGLIIFNRTPDNTTNPKSSIKEKARSYYGTMWAIREDVEWNDGYFIKISDDGSATLAYEGEVHEYGYATPVGSDGDFEIDFTYDFPVHKMYVDTKNLKWYTDYVAYKSKDPRHANPIRKLKPNDYKGKRNSKYKEPEW